jgi:pimeloyl-ACP methyl ester carboxylesterase
VSTDIQQNSAEIDGLHVEWLEAGSGPLAICLHGFPDSAHSWKHLLPALADAGYRAVAPWTRGYAPSAVPADGLYQSGVRGRDACQLHEALGGDGDAVIIGHDFGAGAATVAAVMEPERWRKVVTMSVPPAGRVAAAFFQYAQVRRSSYMFFFQHPLSEMIVPHEDWAFIRGLWNDWSPGFDGASDVANFIESAAPEGHLQAMLGYYRAIFQPELQSPDFADWQEASNAVPEQPMLYLHGRTDGCIGVELTDDLEGELSPGSKVVVFDDIGHFMQLEDPELVNQTIVDFLAEERT